MLSHRLHRPSSSRLAVAASVALVACAGSAPEPARPPAPVASASTARAPSVAPLEVRLLAFNDFHGHLKTPPGHVHGVSGEVGGAAYFASHLKRLGAGQPRTLVVAAGDLVGGSPLTSALFHDEPTVLAMNAMGLDVTSMGNHELDEGMPELLRLAHGGCHPKDGCGLGPTFPGAKYAILGANVRDKSSGAHPLPPYVVREIEGVPIGFIGMPLEDTPGVVLPASVEGLKFDDEVKTVAALVPELKQKGVRAIVLLIHQGGTVKGGGLDDCNDLHGPIVKIAERLDPEIDVVVSAHTHALYNCRVAGRPVTSALSFGRVITTIDLKIDRATRDVVSVVAKNHAVTHDVAPDPAVQAIVDRAIALAAPKENRVVGRLAKTIRAATGAGGESALGDLVADAQLEATKKSGAQLALMNPGGLRNDLVYERTPPEAEDGLVTYGEAFAAQPFGNTLVTVTLTGKELLTLLETEGHGGSPLQVSEGVTYRWSAKGAKLVTSLKLGGRDIGPDERLRVTVNSFMAETMPILKRAPERTPGGMDVDALEAYFAAHRVVELAKTPRIEREKDAD